MVTFNSTKKKNTGGGNPSYVGNNQSGYSAESGSDEKNKGGVLGGLGYVGAGLAAGIGSVGEGIIDLLLAGGGLLTGNVDYAKHVFKDNTVGNWFADVTEDFNPGTGWEFAGNVTHGLGQSSVFLLNLIPGLGQLGTAAFFAGVGSQGISSAAATTGDVGFKEVAYGVASGAVEGALEKAFGGMGKAVKALGGSTMKNITKTAVRKGLVKQVLSDAAGEFGEEFASEYIDTFLQRGFQIDPNKTTSLRDALYAGAVGFTSGAVSAGFANVLKAVGNEREGERVIKNGNSQTLVNTATKVADKLAAQGTNWDRAGEWVKALRGQVDAYNKLSEGEKTGMRGKTILGEMKSSLFFAETQSTFDLVKKSIQNSDEQTRATFAEYINRSVEKGKRNGKDYTAADIAKDTDGVAWQLAIYKFVPSLFDLDGALADIEQEQAIADFVAEKQGAMKRDVVDTEIASAAAGAPAMNTPHQSAEQTASPEGRDLAAEGARLATVKAEKYSLDETVDGRNVAVVDDDILSGIYTGTWDKATSEKAKKAAKTALLKFKDGIAVKGITARVNKTSRDEYARSNYSEALRRHDGEAYADKMRAASVADDVVVAATNWSRDGGLTHPRKDDFVDFDRGQTLILSGKNKYSATVVLGITADGEYVFYDVEDIAPAQFDIKKDEAPPAVTPDKPFDAILRDSNGDIITQPEGKVNPEMKENVSKGATDEKGKNSRSEAVGVKAEETGANNVESASATAEATAEVAKSVDGEVDLEKAKRDAERMIAWEKKSAPTTSELNTLRDYVNDFDYLPKDRQMAILRMVRSSNGVDQKTVKGVANLMAITNKKGQVLAPDLEFRFADGLGDKRGIKVSIGDKTLALLNSDADHKDTIRGSIVHEIVHYLENRKGYKALAEYARKIAKPELVEKIKKNYGNYYAAKYAKEERASDPKASLDEITKRVRERMQTEEFEALIDSEITAKVVGNALNSEKFLKRYAQVGEEKGILKTAARFIKGIFNSTKDKDAELSREAQNLAVLFDRALASEVEEKQKSGEKYSFAGDKAETADKVALAHAKEMLADGVDSETIRKETGWFMSYDGKWRFEIDDFESGLIENPKLERHEDDGEIYFTGKLTDIFNHDALFKAYPELKNINIVIQKTEFGVYGIYQPNSNYITLSIEHFKRTTKEYYDYANGGRKAEIERIEATPEFQEYNSFYDKDADDIIDAKEWLRQEQELRDRFFSSELGKRYYQLMWGKSGFTGNKYEFGWGTGGKETLLHELQHAIQNIEGFASGTSTRDTNYSRNAGELEAYDTERRTNLTVEERKNTRPDIDREDVVLAKGSVSYYAANDKNAENDSIKKQLRDHLDDVNAMDPVTNVTFDPNDVTDNIIAKTLAWEEFQKAGKQIDRQNFGIILIGKDELGGAMAYVHTDAERAALLTIPKVLKRGKIISGHEDHKNNGFPSVTIAAPVLINGVRGNVAVVVQQQGKNKYHAHRILLPDGAVFVIKNKDAELSTASMSSNETRQRLPNSSASNSSIHQNKPIVNPSKKKSDPDAEYMNAVNRGDMETAQRMVDEAAKEAGYVPVTRYHQTGKKFTRFSNKNPDAALNDSDTPNGYFFKENDHDIGVGADFVNTGHGGSIQMPVYLKHNNLLYFENREAAQKWYSKHVPGYGDLLRKYNEHIDEYKRIDKENTAKMFDELNALVEKGEDTPDNETAVIDKYDKIIDNWIAEKEAYETSLRAQMRQLLNGFFIESDSGYDGIELADDGHRYIDGKREDVHTYIAFKNTQIKSANPVTYDDNGKVIPLSKRFKINNDDIRYDLDPEIEAEIEAKYGDNEFFAAAVRRAYEPDSQSAENTRLTKEQLRESAIEKRKRDFNKVIARAVTIQRQIEKMQKQTEGEVDVAKLKKLKKELKTSLGTIGAMQIELRQMGYEVSAEQRRIERLEAQNENQGEQIRTLKQEKRELELAERERHILDMAEKQEKARAAKIAAKQKQEIGKVYSEAEFKRDMQDMMDRGLISKFFGGEYMPHIDKAKNNAIAQYIAIRLNTAGSFEAAKKDGIVSVVTNDILRNMYFLDETGEKNYLHSLLDEETMSQFKDMLETDVVSILSNAGELNPYAELMRKFRQLEGEYKTKLAKNNEGEAWGKEFPKVVAEAKRMRNFAINKKGIAADGVQEVLKAFATLTDEGGRLYSGRVDGVMQAALSFFEGEAMRTNSERGQVDKDNKIADDSMIWDIDPDLKDAIELFVQMRKGREGTLMNSQELKLVREILSGMRTSLERYNKEKIGGKFVDIDRAAGEKVRFMQTDVESKTFTSKLLNSKLGRAFRNAYFYEVLSPATVFESLDGYEIGGLLTTLYRDIRMAAQSATDMKARLKDPFVRYVDDKENAWKDEKGHSRSYRQKLNEKKISVDGVNITLGEAINLYMLTKREHAHLGLKEGGFVTYDENGVKVAKIKIPDIEIARNNLYNQFDATDRKFIEMAEDFFNKTASKIKEDADIEIYGYSKNSEGYYVPIVRDHYSRNNGVTDVRQSISNFATVNNKSFTKDLVRNAKPLEGQNILGLIETHADGLADYANLYMPLKAFDRVYNRGVSIDGGEVTTLREQLNEEWNGAHKYFTKLFKDIQGVRDGDPPSNVDKVASWIRSNWVASVLGANLKVVCTQTTSLGAATQIIDAKYVTKASWIITPGTGFAKGVKEIAERADKYSKTIFSRSFDAGAVKAQGNLDKIGNIAKGASTLIGIQDRKVCIALFHAAELSVEASTGHKVGTEENSVLAAKLVDEAILTTQAMESQAEKSNLQRANSELAKLFSMFTSDSVKNLSHLISNISRYAAHKNRAKNGDARYEAELKKDGKAARRSMRTMLITGVMLGVITQGFKYLYGKEEEDEKKLQDFAVDIVSSTVNVFPIISEIVDKIAFDYDMSVNVLDVVNDTLETFGDSFELMGKAMGGEYVSGQAIGKSAINVSKSAFSLFGIPVAPAERTITGLLRRFSPGTIYGYDSMMYSATYSADLQAAVESGDEALAEHILETIYKNEATGVYSTPELEEIVRLYGLGNTSVIPQKIGATVNDVKLDRKQRAQFEKIYGEASAKVNELIRSEYYAELDDEQRAKAIKTLYSLYYNRAAADVAGVEWSNAQAYSRLTDNYALLFSSQAYKSGLTEYKNLRGKVVSVKDQFVKYVEGLRLDDADKLVILYANGYRDAKTKAAMISYINALSLSDEEKAKIAERLGFDFKDGKVSEKEKEYEIRA